MTNKPDVVQIKMDKSFNPQASAPTKAFQVRVDDNKTVIVYNPYSGIHFRSFNQGSFQMILLDMRKIKGIYLICGKTDLRRGIDELANIVLDQFKLDPYSKSLYLFCGTRKDRFKALY